MIEKSRSAYEYIKEMILSGELPPKIDISEKQLQETLGISRTPIHEALKRLQDEKFIETYPRKGTFVTDVTIEIVRDIYETRLLIEPFITRNAVDTASKEWMEDLRRRLVEEHSLQDKSDIHAVMALDTELHAVIVSSCSNSFLRESLGLVYEHDRRIRLKTDQNPAQVRFSQKEHVKILDAMLSGNREETEQFSREHVIHSRDLTFESLGFLKTDYLSELPTHRR